MKNKLIILAVVVCMTLLCAIADANVVNCQEYQTPQGVFRDCYEYVGPMAPMPYMAYMNPYYYNNYYRYPRLGLSFNLGSRRRIHHSPPMSHPPMRHGGHHGPHGGVGLHLSI